MNNYAFIDLSNIYLETRKLGWYIDWKLLRIRLKDIYHVSKAYIFIGYREDQKNLYIGLQEAGFILIFKPVLHVDGFTKGNCDAEFVLQAMIDFTSYDRAILVSGDGDFACLIKYLREENKLHSVISVHAKSTSQFTKKEAQGRITFLTSIREFIEYKKTARTE